MNPKRQKEKERRRARKLAEQAWEAANDDQNLDLAEKLIRRAVATQPDNPVLWNDQGRLLCLRRKEAEAEQSFRTALSMAPNFAEPYAQLAAIRLRQGLIDDAIALQSQAVKYARHVRQYAEQLNAFQSLVVRRPLLSGVPREEEVQAHAGPGAPCATDAGSGSADPPTTASVDPRTTELLLPSQLDSCARGLTALNWDELSDRLTREGCVMLPESLDRKTCIEIGAMFDEDQRFAKTVIMDRPDFGRGVYRYFQAPIPDMVDALRRLVYPYVAKIANRWQELLGEPDRYPEQWDIFRADCREAGQTVPTPILLKYGPGGFNALHRDLRGTVFFPIQMAVVLSRRAAGHDPASDGFHGGDFLLCDVPERKKSQRRSFPAGQGDMLLFCTRDRLVAIGGVYGLQPVKHGVSEITAGERLVLGVPFHEYR